MPDTRIDEATLRSLRQQMGDRVLVPGDAGYDDARRIWNGRFDRRPGAIARCRDAGDVKMAVDLARDAGLPTAVRSGGHDYAGHSMCDDGLVIDLSRMNEVVVDAEARTVRVGPGARWADVDREAQAFGLATTGGTVSSVGVAGFTLGGGTGHLVRKYGLALDNLLSVDLVTAAGERLRASEREHADLFWGLRGGSGNLGIVTSLELRLHDLGTEIFAGQIIHPLEDAADTLRFYRDFMAHAPDEVQCYAFFIRIPPVAPFPESLHGRVALDLVVSCAGGTAPGENVLAPLRAFGLPRLDTVARVPYLALQQAFDAGMPAGNRWYTRAHYLADLTGAAIETIVSRVAALPGEFSMVYLEPQGGAIARVAADATAFPHREAKFALHVFPGWTQASDDSALIDWTKAFHRDMQPHATGGAYVNMLAEDEPDGAERAYGANRSKLSQLKHRFDPGNLFRRNHNVEPSS